MPPVIILAGAIILFRSLKEWTKPKAAAPIPGEARSEPSPVDAKKDDYVARLEEELKEAEIKFPSSLTLPSTGKGVSSPFGRGLG